MIMTLDIDRLLSELTLEEKASLTSGSAFWYTTAIDRLGIPRIMVSDGPHGLRAQPGEGDHVGIGGSLPATCFPTASAIASSWNPELLRRVGVALGREARACNLSVILGPGINMKRSPLCGRNFEYLSEDPYLAGELAVGIIEGIQSQGVGTSVKHYAANNQEDDRLRVDDELLTRIRSLLRIKRYHDTIKEQAAELLELNRTLEERVRTQVEELERLQRLRRFLSPQLADAIVCSGDDSILRSHRRQVAMFFADLRGWTSFVDAVEPEELMRVLGEFHSTIGGLVQRFDATVGFLEGDGVQLFFNDPVEMPDAALRAVQLGCALREEMAELTPQWRKRGYDLDFGAGIALGYATCGEIGFEGRSDYAAIGAVTNLAARLADEATGGQILIEQRLCAEVEDDVDVEPVGEVTLKGFSRPVAAFNVIAVRETAAELSPVETA